MTPRGKILIVDDDRGIRFALLTALGDLGFATKSVDSAEAALVVLAVEPFDLVLLDKNMGGMSGVEMLLELRKRGNSTWVALMTSEADPQMAVATAGKGVYGFFPKPFDDIGRVCARVAQLVDARTGWKG